MAEALGIASSVIAVVDLSAKVFSLCLQYSREVKNAKDDIARLCQEIAAFQVTAKDLKALLESPRGRDLKTSQELVYAIEDGHSMLGKLEQRLAQHLQPSTCQKAMSRFGIRAFKWPFESKDIKETIQNLGRYRGTISLALNIDQTAIVQNVEHKIALDTLPIAEGASFDSHAEEHNPKCLPNTRVELLNDINHWVDSPDSKTIFWLNGMAGTGKSTISRTVSQSRSDEGDLGASFFFKRGEADRGSLAKFVPTVARRLAWSMPGIAPFIKNAVDADSAIIDKAIREQFEKLVREPLLNLTATSLSRPSVVIVIDALDECDSDADIKLLLELFSTLRFAGPIRVRVLITSRPELPVRLGFSSIGDTHQDLVLHKIPQPIIKHDISVFLRHELANIRNRYNEEAVDELKLPADWPGEANLDKLTMAAVPLFIFAATLCRFINDSCLGSPDELLDRVLHVTSTGQASKLDMTYLPVLKQQVINRSEREGCGIIDSFRLIVGTIVTLASPLSMRALALLLDVDVRKVMTRLSVLRSVLDVPESLDTPVRLFHLSFRDYVVNLETREAFDFWVDEEVVHRNLAEKCLRIMYVALHENICGLAFPGMHRSAVEIGLLKKRIPPELEYACIYWIHHQTKVDFKPGDSSGAYDFMKTHFLNWVEALSLLGRLKECLNSLKLMTRWLEKREDSNLSLFVADAVRFLQANISGVARAPLQIYSSCLIFAPRQSIIRKTFEDVIPKWISILPKTQENWETCLLILDGHRSSVSSVVFLYNSKTVASASCNKTIRIWDAETGNCEQVLEGHSDWVNSVVFSHNLMKLASASDDKTIRIWNMETRNCEQVLEGHSDYVNSVVFSHDSKKLASASWDQTIRIWDAETGNCEQVLKGHSDKARSAVFSHDLKKVASASRDNTIRIWDIETGKCEQVLEGHSASVSSVVFSHNSIKLASASWDQTIRIWNMETRNCEQVLEGHSDYVNSVVFSRDSKKLASASDDKTIRIWDAETGDCKQVLKGHSDKARSAVFSHDLKKVASASQDNTIRIWDIEAGKCEQVPQGHSDYVNSVVFSHDSKKLASASDDKIIQIWNVEKGECERVIRHYSGLVYSMFFSRDTTMLASTSNDKTVRVWHVETGECKEVIPVEYYYKGLSFTNDSCGLLTSTGIIPLTHPPIPSTQTAAGLPYMATPFLRFRGGAWITMEEKDLLWLPAVVRCGPKAISRDTVAMGCKSGRVMFLRISAEGIAKMAQTC